jgi:hypothetical protein
MDDATKVAVITAAIAHSQIVCARTLGPAQALPFGFDEVDVAILEWIAVEGRRVRSKSRSTGEWIEVRPISMPTE